MKMSEWFSRKLATFRNSALDAGPPSPKANFFWIVGSLAAAWLLGYMLTTRFPWLWNLKVTIALYVHGISDIPIPPFSWFLFFGSALGASLIYLIRFYWFAKNGTLKEYIKEVGWRNFLLLFGIPAAAWAGNFIMDALSKMGATNSMAFLNKMANAGIEFKFAYAEKPMTIMASFGGLLLSLGGVLYLVRKK